MRPLRLRILLLLFALLIPAVTGAVERLPGEIRFDHLRIADGLSSSSVSAVVQDDTGFIWFGTQSGLNRYDGYSVDRFEHDPFDRNSLSHNLIQTLFLDDAGVFWIGTYGGLNRFDPETEIFTRYKNSPGDARSLSNNVVVAVERDASGRLWVGTLDGLNRLAPDEDGFVRYLPDEHEGALPNKVVRAIETDRLGRLWVGTYGGLSRYLPDDDTFATISTEGPDGTTLPSPFVMTVVPDPTDDWILWVGTWDGGVSRLDTKSGRITTIALPNDDVYTMRFDSSGRLWVGTWGGGLAIVDVESELVRTITAEGSDRTAGLTHDVVYSLLEDASGIMWVGTNGGGVNTYVPWENRFETIVNEPGDPNTIAAGKIEAIHIDPDGTAWFGVYNGGLNRYDRTTDTVRRYAHDPDDPRSLSNDIVNAVIRDSRGRLWVATNEGLNRYREDTDDFDRILAKDGSLPEDTIFEIRECPNGELWLGTNTAGVVVLDPDALTYRTYAHDPADRASLSDNLVRSIVPDDRGFVWIGTNNGLNRLDPTTGAIVRFLHDVDDPQSISSNNVRSIHQDRAGRLWITTTGGGVNQYDYESGAFTMVSTRDGLASHHVVGVVEDDSGSLWFPTNRGISIYDPRRQSFRTLNASNGLLSNELTQAVARDPDGTLYFGSAAGVTVVDPARDEYAGFSPPVVITRFEVLGVPHAIDRRDNGIHEPVVLDHADNFFSFEFSALDYSTPSHNTYEYMLDGFDSGWNTAGNRNYGSYTNIGPGTYTLLIRGAGSRGNWNEEGVSLPIVVEPPWWRSPLANAAYAALLVATLVIAWSVFRRRRSLAGERLVEQERIHAELEQKVAERTAEIERSRSLAERATREKSLFLANMSHEIRTPLNGMTGMMSMIASTTLDDQQREYLSYLQTSSENLTTLVNDLLDFERIEAGELRLVEERFSIGEAAHYIDQLFRRVAEEKGLELTVDVDLADAPDAVMGDRNRFVQILTNLVSNAVKYTHEGSIVVRIGAGTREAARRYRIEVADTGIGIELEKQAIVFERFRQIDDGYSKSARGVGLGLAIVKQVVEAMEGTIEVKSVPGEGSRFVVTLPFASAAEPAPAAEEATTPAPVEAQTGRLLICEDEAINRLYLTTHLESLGYAVDTAADGAQAVDRATGGAFDLVLMDLGMPGLSGLEATERIRSWEREHGRPRTPIVALTAHTYPEDVERCRMAGMDGFVAKPIREAELAAALTEWLGR